VAGQRQPVRIRFRVPLTVAPLLCGVAVAVPLWGTHSRPEFFTAATHVLAIGAVGLALTGRFFRLATHIHEGPAGVYVLLNVLGVLVTTGLGLFFAFRALASGHSGAADLAITSGALVTGILAFGVQAMFGTPGMRDDTSDDDGL
jgi:hypothetical protein